MGMFKKEEPIKGTITPTIGNVETAREKSVIGRTLYIKGEINSDEEVLIEGKVEGKIKINHRVVIGRNGIVNADIEAKEVIIKGAVTGNLKCSYKVEIVPDGSLTGNIVSHRVVLAEGSIFIGNIAMTDDNGKLIRSGKKEEEKKKPEVKPETKSEPTEKIKEKETTTSDTPAQKGQAEEKIS